MNGKTTNSKENRYEVDGLTDHRNRVASGCAANASAIFASTNNVDILSGGDYDTSYVNGDTAGSEENARSGDSTNPAAPATMATTMTDRVCNRGGELWVFDAQKELWTGGT
ncbi:hypothetical protein L1887_36078 [Cichorium endivia]|nr:hypothetical protein L1887_36078 [Cichorium endivia]